MVQPLCEHAPMERHSSTAAVTNLLQASHQERRQWPIDGSKHCSNLLWGCLRCFKVVLQIGQELLTFIEAAGGVEVGRWDAIALTIDIVGNDDVGIITVVQDPMFSQVAWRLTELPNVVLSPGSVEVCQTHAAAVLILYVQQLVLQIQALVVLPAAPLINGLGKEAEHNIKSQGLLPASCPLALRSHEALCLLPCWIGHGDVLAQEAGCQLGEGLR
mmetsp:Transcript_6862/g.12098  ORF Transcript_6862/g.12098 Transcript_6862/m.12098 type:complete len:216 (-) Transcript_6862:760-1407(-)